MKLKLLTLALLLTTFAQASHILGGEISWTCLPGGQYKFTLVLYRDCTGIPLPSLTESINTNAGAIITCTRTQVIYLNKECNPPTCLGANAGYMGAVEKNIYESGPITLNGTPPPAGWYFTWNSCCRPPNTSNIQNASSQGFTLLAMMYPFIPVGASTPQTASICYDSSPAFEEEPNLVFCAGSNSNYFGITSDLDGDSTFYRLTTPLSTGIVPPFTNVGWVSGYSTNSPLPNTSMNSNNVPANLDSLSGNMTFKSYTTGVFATSIKASSFRNGQLMAEVYRDAPVFIKNCAPPSGLCTPTVQNYPTVSFGYWPNTQDSLMNMSNSSLTGYEAYKRVAKAQIGDTIKFTLHSQDVDLMPNCTPESIIIRAWGNGLSKGPLYDSINDCSAGLPCATLESLNSGGGFTSVLNNSIAFTWPITCDVRNGKHEFFFEISNNNCPLPTVKRVKVIIDVNNPAHLQSPVFDTLISGINTSGDVELFWNKPDTATSFSHYVLLHQYGSNAPFILDSLMNYSDTSYVHVSPPSGTLRYWIRAVGGCFNSLDSVLLSSDSTSSITLKNTIGIEEQLAHIKYYPQPMQNKVVFDGLEGAVNLDVQIFEVSGRLLRSEIIENVGDKFEVEVADLKNGVYVFVLSWADYSTAIKLIKHE